MDAVKFIKERDRMCRFYHHAGDCYQCPAKDCECSALEGMVDDDNIVTIVEEWSAAHPRKTRQSVFLDNYPCARIDSQSVLYACPADAYGNNVCPKNKNGAPIICYDCRREFWMKEVE